MDNLLLKVLSLFSWPDMFCTKATFLVKADEDVFIQMIKLPEFTMSIKNDKLYGNIWRDASPNRNQKSKDFVSFTDFEGETFYDYLSGPAYLVPIRFTGKIARAKLEHTFSSITDDVMLTGIIPEQLGIPRFHSDKFSSKRQKVNCKLSKFISIHGVSSTKKQNMQKFLDTSLDKCKKKKKKPTE